MPNYLVFPDDAEQGTPKFFRSLKTAKAHAATLARARNLNVRVWKENLKTGIMKRAATVRPAYLKPNPSPGTRVQTTVGELKKIYSAGLRRKNFKVKVSRPATKKRKPKRNPPKRKTAKRKNAKRKTTRRR
jgi:hypothetical protein